MIHYKASIVDDFIFYFRLFLFFSSDPRKDPLLGPLLAELDAMSTNNTNSLPQNPSSTYQRDFVPYNRPVGLPQTNQSNLFCVAPFFSCL